MCACKIEEETDFRSIILHRKERRSNKPLPKDVEWMLEKSEEQENLFQRLPSNQDNILPLDRQTYQQWKALYETQKFAHPIRMRRRSIILQPLSYSSPCYRFSSIDPGIVECLTEFCRCFFTGMDILTTPPIDISEVNKIRKRVHDETGREQLLADDLLRYLKSHVLRNSFCVVGVIIADLYPSDNWNFTLGHASLTDGVAIVSFGRHFNSSDMDNVLTPYQLQLTNLWTLVNVLVHELCHVFGMTHCYYFACLMNESSTIDEAITQPLFLCPICLRKLHKVLRFSVMDRYMLLKTQCCKLEEYYRTQLDHPVSESVVRYLLLIKKAIDWIIAVCAQ